jgi:hypothetical protein
VSVYRLLYNAHLLTSELIQSSLMEIFQKKLEDLKSSCWFVVSLPFMNFFHFFSLRLCNDICLGLGSLYFDTMSCFEFSYFGFQSFVFFVGCNNFIGELLAYYVGDVIAFLVSFVKQLQTQSFNLQIQLRTQPFATFAQPQNVELAVSDSSMIVVVFIRHSRLFTRCS